VVPIAVKKKKPLTERRRPLFHERLPYNLSISPILKQFPTVRTTFNNTAGGPAFLDLISTLAPGDSDNTRLSDVIVSDNVELHIETHLIPGGVSPSYAADVHARFLLCASLNPADTTNPLTTGDPFGTINNSIVPSQVMVFWDSGVKTLTPSMGIASSPSYSGTPTLFQQMDHRTYTVSAKVNLHQRGVGGVGSQFNGTTLINGSLYLVCYSDQNISTPFPTQNPVTTSFSVGFHDYVPALQSSIAQRLANLERSQKSVDDINAKLRKVY